MPRFLPLPDVWARTADLDEPIGRVYLRAGRAQEALPFLNRAAHSCLALEFPIDRARATEELAEALEATRGTTAACAEYVRLNAAWSEARSRSVARANLRDRALACDDRRR
jgi:serine/threonine-protein kinase